MSRVESTVLSIALLAVVTLAAYTDVLFVAAVIVIAQFMIASAPAPSDDRGRHINCPRFWPAIAAGIVATFVTVYPEVLVGASGTQGGSVGFVSSGLMAAIVPAMAIGLFGAILGQMFRTDGRHWLVSSLCYATTLCMFAVLPVGWLGAAQSLGGEVLVALGASAVGAALLIWLVPGERALVGAVAVIAAGGTAVAASYLLDGPVNLGPVFAVLLGMGAGMFAILGQVLGRAWSKSHGHAASGWGFAGAMSVALSAPVVFIGSQFLGATIRISL